MLGAQIMTALKEAPIFRNLEGLELYSLKVFQADIRAPPAGVKMIVPRVTAGDQHFPGRILCSELRYLADDFQEHRRFSSLVSWLPPCTRVLCLSQSIHSFPVMESE